MRAKENVTQADAGTSIAGSILVERMRFVYIYMFFFFFRERSKMRMLWEDSKYPKTESNVETSCYRKKGFCAKLCDQSFFCLF